MRLAPSFAVLSTLVLLGSLGVASAQQLATAEEPEVAMAEGPQADPPGRVARLSFIRGDVAFQAAEGETPEDAVINRPVTSGDRLMTQKDSRAELTMGIAAVRVDENTDLSIAVIEEDIAQIEVNSGTISVHVRELLSGNTFEVDTPNSAIRLLAPGEYRVEVLPDGTATLAVREGDAEIDTGSGPVRVGARQVAQLTSGAQFASVRGIDRMDEFDEWSVRRERELNGQQATRYVSRETVGYEDLDNYGTWQSEPEYGNVWYPSHVSVGWAPYRFGSWSWIGPWGWTWIDTAPWGFAPYHYGRWAFVRSRWCWVPGPRFRRPVYAPGLVVWTGWHGGHSHFRHSRHHRPSSWYPLGPRDVYIPRHHVSPRYLRNVNASNTFIDNNTHLTNAYRNRLRDLRFSHRDMPGARSNGPDHEPDRSSRWRNRPGFAANDGHSRWQNRGNDGRRNDDWRRHDNDRNRGDHDRGGRDHDGNRNGGRWGSGSGRDAGTPGFAGTRPGGGMTIPRTPERGRGIHSNGQNAWQSGAPQSNGSNNAARNGNGRGNAFTSGRNTGQQLLDRNWRNNDSGARSVETQPRMRNFDRSGSDRAARAPESRSGGWRMDGGGSARAQQRDQGRAANNGSGGGRQLSSGQHRGQSSNRGGGGSRQQR